MANATDPETLFARLVERYADDPPVSVPIPGPERRFGDAALKVGGKIFAMTSKGRLVVKLPRQRVDELISSNAGSRFDPGHGRLMKEWVTIDAAEGGSWSALADEARRFVGGPPA
ncbi:MAG: hypothetical protein ACRDM1_03075 [Gaiellaceae bacterium]